MDSGKSTSASRMKKMREKQKAANPNEYLEKERKRIAEFRQKKKEKMTVKEKAAQKLYERNRKRLQRAKAKVTNVSNVAASTSSNNSSPASPYSCKQTLSKAVWRTVRSLPNSPRKQRAVVTGLAKRVGISLSNIMEENLACTSSRPTQIEEATVTNFFYRPDIVYTCPGIKDVITVWQEGKKEKLQKHYMTMFLHEAFSVFKEENQEVKIGFSKFCSLRPKNVLLLKETPAEQCKCRLHENFIMKLKALKYTYNNDFWKNLLCDDSLNSPCWQNLCENCSEGKRMLLPSDPDSKVNWKEWRKVDDNKLKLAINEDFLGDIHEMLIKDLPQMMLHVNTKRVQHSEFETDKKNVAVRILQIDFAMSFSSEYQNEIQSALWSRTSVLLFTAAVFCGENCKTYVICSDTKNKDKDTIFVFLDFFYSEIIKETPGISEEVIWSDGPSSEFKNKFMVRTLQLLAQKHNRKFTWKYFATSHGKGVVDGVGGNIKRLVRMKMMAQGENECVIQSAKDFAAVAAELNTKTEVWYLGEDLIENEIESKKPWENVQAVPGIKELHLIQCSENGYVYAKKNAFSNSIVEPFTKARPTSINLVPGNWVVVTYDGKEYPGEIIFIENENKVQVSVMVPTGPMNHFKWPHPRDCIFYTREEIVREIDPPEVANSRGLFRCGLV